MSASLHIPRAVVGKTTQDIEKKMLQIQSAEGGKVSILSIYWDGNQHVLWYLPLKYFGGGLL